MVYDLFFPGLNLQLLKLRSNCDGQIFISFIFSFVIFSFRKVSIFFRLVVASGLNFLRRKTEQEALIFELVTGPAKAVLSMKNVLIRNVL